MAPELGNTTGLAFPNSGTLGGRTGAPRARPIRGRPRSNGRHGVNLPAPPRPRRSASRSASINGAFNLDVALTALERTGKGRILSTPRLTTQNNIEAEVAQGVQIPIQTVANNTVTVHVQGRGARCCR